MGSTGSSVVLPLTPKMGGGYVVELGLFGGHMSRDNTFEDFDHPGIPVKWGARLPWLGPICG